jgi:uncharacterized membrane protein YfcA
LAAKEKKRLVKILLIGLVAGCLGGILGVGGGVVMIPLMVDFLKFKQHDAHGTSLVAVVCTGIVGTVTYYIHGTADFLASLLIAGAALATARLGVRYCCILPEVNLKRSFGAFLLLVAALLVFKPYLPNLLDVTANLPLKIVAFAVLGLLTGFLSGMMGVGGGVFMVPMMILFIGVGQHTAQGISLLAMIPASALGAWSHHQRGNVRTEALAGLIAGILIGTYFGGSVAHLLPEAPLRLLFTVLLAYTGVRYLRTKKAAGA